MNRESLPSCWSRCIFQCEKPQARSSGPPCCSPC
jgi:hypothetical protein